MKTYRIVIIAALALVAVALVTTSAYAYMGGRAATPNGTNTGVSGAYGTYQGGMMGGRGMMGGYAYSAPAQPTVPAQPGTPTTTTPPYQYYGGMGCGGMRAWTGTTAPSYTSPTTGTPINITTAVTTAQNYVASLNNPNLAVAQVEEYTQNFYVQVKEKDTGVGAFELLINKYTGTISPEMGPNMMWNTKYGMMSSGMMGYYYTSTPTATMPVTVNQAKTDAQQFLNTYYAGTTVGDATTFYGYYTIEVLNAGSPSGMLSVNGYTGQVWYHTWHGTFIQEWTP
jgi:hypothetical protein